jgi:hypothetical protein
MTDVPVRLVAGVFDDDGTLRYEDDEFAVSEAAFDEHPELERAEDDDPECADENCSRGVDEPGDRCWQHSEDDEDGNTDEE